jgi:hypothetical protein
MGTGTEMTDNSKIYPIIHLNHAWTNHFLVEGISPQNAELAPHGLPI